ncbi:TetR/AcrR family transcriptional regulator [Azotobacter salinestris]|uniref:TetR/AcrR family transcriptional regulator n=1 Tax=Azotobacter salinestris TaxID=69964 RepID=UPI001266A050|nr:TetR/AcrR family transcriptional regulator [Azotobacter salinestris]
MPHSETVERILEAAELLFAQRGFAETSLRLITSRADVNLAAVNYHFGSKSALIEAVFSRVLGPFCAGLERELDRRQSVGMSLEELLEVTIAQVQAARPRSGMAIFMRLLGLALGQGQEHLRRYLEDTYGKLFRRYLLLLEEAVPGIPPLELFWRTHFMLGAATFSLSGIDTLCASASERFEVQTSSEQALRLLVPFLAAGMRAGSAIEDPQLVNARPRPRGKAVQSSRSAARPVPPEADE